ncbi:Methyl acetate hydrolase [Exophiala dermatitidis]
MGGPNSSDMAAKLRPLLEAAVKEKKVPAIGAFIVDSEGNFRLKETFGTTNMDDPNAAPFDADTTTRLFSCSKLITTIAALQLLEQGKLSLSDPVEKYVPRISKIQVLESFTTNDKGQPQPIFRSPKSKPTIHQLMTHTSGFSYDFFDKPTLQWRLSTGQIPAKYNDRGNWEDFETPFVADPGAKYVYGTGTDWLGLVVQQIAGLTLPEYVDKFICQQLGMTNTRPILKDPQEKRLIVHVKGNDGKFKANPALKNAENPQVYGGGGCFYSTMNDFSKLLSTLLNGGTSPQTQKSILKPETVREYLFKDQLPAEVDKSGLGEIRTSIPAVSNEGSFLPSCPLTQRGWSCALLINHQDLPRGRKRGSGAWAGLGNLYYWIDPTEKIAGMVVSAVFPFFDPTVLKLFEQLERVAYGHEPAGLEDDGLSNFSVGAGRSPAPKI